MNAAAIGAPAVRVALLYVQDGNGRAVMVAVSDAVARADRQGAAERVAAAVFDELARTGEDLEARGENPVELAIPGVAGRVVLLIEGTGRTQLLGVMTRADLVAWSSGARFVQRVRKLPLSWAAQYAPRALA